MTDAEVVDLCDQAMALQELYPQGAIVSCSEGLGVAIAASVLSRDPVSKHVRAHLEDHSELALFVYGHTHEAQTPRFLFFPDDSVKVVNTGAFQRLADKRALEHQESDGLELAAVTPEGLPPCYSFVMVRSPADVQLLHWYQTEQATAGEALTACDFRCSPKPIGCP